MPTWTIPRNGDEIGENELLVVSFGTSFNSSRVADIKGIEDALQAAYPIGPSAALSPHRSSSTMCRPAMARKSIT